MTATASFARTRIGIILGSTRPHRKGADVARWALEVASKREDADFELVDLADDHLPFLDEPFPPSFGRYQNEHTQKWAARIAGFDGFVIVTPEYNHSAPAVLSNAMSYLFGEWNNKAVGFISYGAHGGVRAVEHLRAMAGELMMADVRTQVALSFSTEWVQRGDFAPGEYNLPFLDKMLDQVITWTNALAPVRNGSGPTPRAGVAS